MANYNTTSGFSDLVGSMVVTDNNVTSYSSNTQGTGTITPPNAPATRFTVRFGSGRAYNINATANGTGFNGSANNNGPEADQQAWEATATVGEEVATQKA